ncbi:MAG: DNA repair protein RecN [Bacteroidales bacterium]|jgi:DNA repair protein RecN (Recombination protein N)|nr:DNA repair protein RecN [Bacteroidales bacterium]NLD64315.1 DNA repair protein RecN [Bacteroidales bacterium]
MLRRLTVRNYAIIKELDMAFGEGFTIITGETGAGKSILLGALGLVLGERADTSVLLSHDEKCIVEAEFNIRGYDLEEIFGENGVDYDDDALLRREITPSGKSRAFLNDTPVNLAVMKELGARLIDVHSQHETLLLGNTSFQVRVIDAYAGTTALAREYSQAWRRYQTARKEYDAAALDLGRARADHDYYSHQLEEFRAVNMVQGEQETLEKEQEMLSNASEIKEALTKVTAALGGEDVSALSLLRTARLSLSRIAGWLPEAGELEKRLETQLIELDDISYEAEKLNESASADPGRLEYITQRLDTIYSLMQKHRCRDIDELLAVQRRVEEAVADTGDADERIKGLKRVSDEAFAEVEALAARLSEARSGAAEPLAAQITSSLRKLGMPHARFETHVKELGAPGPSGADAVEFLFSANRQVEPEELSRCASGGELSRVMLCLKSALASSSGLPAIIFDEIDSGVSGEVASMVGSILADMGKKMQVINITHLPQVASRGSIHYHVYKEESDHSTITRVRLLNDEERVKEVARLLSGSTITEAAIRNARELLKGE